MTSRRRDPVRVAIAAAYWLVVVFVLLAGLAYGLSRRADCQDHGGRYLWRSDVCVIGGTTR